MTPPWGIHIQSPVTGEWLIPGTELLTGEMHLTGKAVAGYCQEIKGDEQEHGKHQKPLPQACYGDNGT